RREVGLGHAFFQPLRLCCPGREARALVVGEVVARQRRRRVRGELRAKRGVVHGMVEDRVQRLDAHPGSFPSPPRGALARAVYRGPFEESTLWTTAISPTQ